LPVKDLDPVVPQAVLEDVRVVHWCGLLEYLDLLKDEFLHSLLRLRLVGTINTTLGQRWFRGIAGCKCYHPSVKRV